MQYDFLLYASVLVTQNAQHEIVHDAYIAISQGKITDIGKKDKLPTCIKADTAIHLDNCLVMPGLINAHTHIAMTFLRGLADDLPLMEWLTKNIFPIEKHLTAEIVYLTSLLGCAEAIRTGTTALSDMYLFSNAVFKAVDEAGIRGIIGEGIFSFPSPAYTTEDAAFLLVEKQIEHWKNHPRLTPAIMPHSIYTTTPSLLTRCKKFAEEHDIPLVIHLAETQSETEVCLKNYGKRPAAFLESLGMLDSHVTIAHGVELNDLELSVLAQHDVKIAHNPKSNMKLASGCAPLSQMLEKGIKVGLGTDGPASNNSLNMFNEMSACALLHKVCESDPTAAPAQTILDLATKGAAATLHNSSIGALEPGMAADLIALDLTKPNMQPMYNPISHLVYATSGHEVCFSMVDGRILYQNDTFTQIDYPSLLLEIEKIKNWVYQKR